MMAIDEGPLDGIGHGKLLRAVFVGRQSGGDASVRAEDGRGREGQRKFQEPKNLTNERGAPKRCRDSHARLYGWARGRLSRCPFDFGSWANPAALRSTTAQ